jgi:hypothetical protein
MGNYVERRMIMAKAWFARGAEGEERQKDIEKEQELRGLAQRFWLKAGSETKMTFLDSEGFYLMQHTMQIHGQWQTETCISDFDNCPICEAGEKASYVCAYTIIDHGEYESKRTPGKIIKNQKKLLVMKQKAHNKLKKRRDAKCGGDLTYAVFSVSRDTPDESAVGESYDFLKKLDKATVMRFAPKELTGKAREEWIKPVDYTTVFAPKSPEALRRLARGKPPVGSKEELEEMDFDKSPPPSGGKVSQADVEADPELQELDSLLGGSGK